MAQNYTLRIDSSDGQHHLTKACTTQAEAVELLSSHIRRWRRAGAAVDVPRGWLGLWTASCYLDGVTYTARVVEPEMVRVPLLSSRLAV